MRLVSFDCETDLIQPGLGAPPLVCGSFALFDGQHIEGAFVSNRADTLLLIRRYLQSESTHITTANGAYDFGVCCAEDPELIPLVFAAYQAGRIHDVLIRQSLDAIYRGCLFLDPRQKRIHYDEEQKREYVVYGALLDPGTGKAVSRYSLSTCVDLVLGRTDAKKNDFWRKRYALLKDTRMELWPADAKQYPQDDVINTLEVHLRQEGYHNLHAEPEQVFAAWALHLACIWGMRTDPERVRIVTERVEAQYGKDMVRFTAVGIYRAAGGINPKTSKPWPASQVGTMDTKRLEGMVSEAYQGDPPRNALTVAQRAKGATEGTIKRDRDTLLESGDELLIALGLAGVNTKAHTQYLEIIQAGTSRPIVPNANVLVKTTRTSYSNPNLQNIPRLGGMRETFCARPGFVYCSVDYASLELCTLAETCIKLFGFSDLAKAINADEDLHVRLGSMSVGESYVSLLAKVQAEEKWAKNIRQGSKAGNYGFGGGMGPAKFVLTQRKDITVTTTGPDGRVYYGTRFCLLFGKDTICGREKIRRWGKSKIPPTCKACIDAVIPLKAAWLRTWSETEPYFEYIARETQGVEGGLLEIPGTGIFKGGCGYTDGANLGFQGPAAVGAKRALTRVSSECYADRKSPLYGSRPVVFVHDEVIAEVPEDRFGPAGERLAQIMRDSMSEICPNVKISAEPAFCRNWNKGMRTLKDAVGNYLIWEEKKAA